jgi:hypothetical protein
MIKCEGIMAFHGSMVYDPPNKKFHREIKGDFIHKQFDGEGYWYDGWSSYDDRFCTIQEEPSASDLIGELEARVNALKGIVASDGNKEEIQRIIDNVEVWMDGVKARIGG